MNSQKSKKSVLFLFSWLVLVGILAACDGQSESAEPLPEQNQAETNPTNTAVVQTTPTPTKIADTPTPAPEPTETAMPEATPTEITMADTTAPLPNIPLPDDAQAVEFADTDLSFASPSDTETLVEFYRQTLSADGWQESADFSQVDEAFAFVEFDRGDEVIYLTMTRIGSDTEVILDMSEALSLLPAVTDDGVAMDAPSGDAPDFTINDWPVPDEATEVNQSGDTLSYKTVLKLVEIAEFYRPTYELLGLGTDCLDNAAEYTSMSCSLSNGDFSVNIFAFEGFDQSEVEISFTNYAQGSTTTDSSDSGDSGELAAIDEEGLPVPDDYTGLSSEGSEFRRVIIVTSPSDSATLLEFFETELVARGWELESGSNTGLTFSGSDGTLAVTLNPAGNETEATLALKNPAAAAAAGILPPAGQARLYLTNFSADALTVTINGQEIKVVAEAGMDSPEDAPKVDLPPGTYELTTATGDTTVTDEIAVGADEVWGLLLDSLGALPLQLY
jgi:hypothetical protein